MREQAHARHRLRPCARAPSWPEDQTGRRATCSRLFLNSEASRFAPSKSSISISPTWLRRRDRGWPWRTVAALRTFPRPCRGALPVCLSTGLTEKPPVGTLLLRALQRSVACCCKKR